ncbi:MAG: hypothetical protein AB9842_05215 [Bacteroidales bacterium]
MKSKDMALRIAGMIFGLVCLLHILRLILQLPVYIGDWLLPLWVNIMGSVGAAILCIWLISLSLSCKNQ